MDDYVGSLSVVETGLEIDTRRVIVFTGNSNRSSKDPVFNQVFQFCGIEIGSGNTAFFIKVAACFNDFFEFLHLYSRLFSRVIILSLDNEPLPQQEKLRQIPLLWEAFRVSPDGRFSRVSKSDTSVALDRDQWMLIEDMLE